MRKRNAFATSSLLIELDASRELPLHRQLYEALRGAILDGALGPGHQIPASRMLAEDLGVSRSTVLQAVDQLKAEGYLKTLVGSGTRVAELFPEKLQQLRGTPVPARLASREISRRGQGMSQLPHGAPRAGRDPTAFRLGIPGLDLFPRKLWNRLLVQRARLTSTTDLDYGHPAGVPELREAIAAHVASARGVRCTPEQVIVVSGAQQGIGFAARMLSDPGDEAWMEEPGYLAARSALAGASTRVVPVPVDAAGLDVAAGIRRSPRARLVYVTPSHQYPLGVTMSLQRRLALLEWARQANAWILEDDYDSDFRYGSRPLMALHGLDGGSRVIYVGTFSKSVFPALRIGFLVVPEELTAAFTRARMYGDQHPAILNQLVLAEFLHDGHFARHVRRMRRAYEQRQEAVVQALRAEAGDLLRVRPARAGLHLVAGLPPELDDQEVARLCLARGLEVAPLSVHYHETARQNGLLLGFASVSEDRLRTAVHRLAEVVRQAPRRTRSPQSAA